MKILPILLINLVVTGGALVIYDQMQDDAGDTTYEMGGADPVAIADIETRLNQLEGSQAAPALAGGGNESLMRRIEALEGRMGGATAKSSDAGTEAGSPTATNNDGPITSFSEDGDVSDGEVRRFRKLMDAANEQRRLEREKEQLARMLEELDISMDEKQQDKYLDARRERQRKMGEMFRNLPRGPEVDREQLREKMTEGRAKLDEEFTVTINKFLPSGDAAKLAERETTNRWGGFSSRRGGDGGGRRGGR